MARSAGDDVAKTTAGAEPTSPVQAASRQRREAIALTIEHAALELFAERSMAKVTVDEVVTEANVALRTFYRYFPTKEHVFAGLPRRAAERLGEAIAVRPPGETPFEALRNVVTEDLVDLEGAELSRWLKAYWQSDAQDRIAAMALLATGHAMTEALGRRAGVDPQDLWPQVAGYVAATAVAVATRHWIDHGGDLVQLQQAALDIAARGLTHSAPPPDPGRATGPS